MPCTVELNSLPFLQGCPSDNELFLVSGATGGSGAGLYAVRKWRDLKKCVTSSVTPYIGVVDRGNVSGVGTSNDPVSGTSLLQDNSLIGLGATNGGNIQMVIDDVLTSNFGLNASFVYNPTLGTVDISPNKFVSGSGIFIDRNQ